MENCHLNNGFSNGESFHSYVTAITRGYFSLCVKNKQIPTDGLLFFQRGRNQPPTSALFLLEIHPFSPGMWSKDGWFSCLTCIIFEGFFFWSGSRHIRCPVPMIDVFSGLLWFNYCIIYMLPLWISRCWPIHGSIWANIWCLWDGPAICPSAMSSLMHVLEISYVHTYEMNMNYATLTVAAHV